MKENNNVWLNGIMGVVVGDSLGVPVEFLDREALADDPVDTMRGFGTYHLPAGSWSDDSSMTLATLDSIKNGFCPEDIMDRFVCWLTLGEYTPFGTVFDVGNICYDAIARYIADKDTKACGRTGEYDNGNGSLMRIMPVCLYACDQQQKSGISDEGAVDMLHEASALTHNHIRSKIACGLYYFMVKSILNQTGSLMERLQTGIDFGVNFYKKSGVAETELNHYRRILDLKEFQELPVDWISSHGYVVDTLEAAIWCLLNSETYSECVLKAVNLGHDTDTVAAIAGGLAGLYYGYTNIPEEWLEEIQRRNWIEEMCCVE